MNQDSVVANISVKLTDLQTQLFGKLNSQSCEVYHDFIFKTKIELYCFYSFSNSSKKCCMISN